MSTGEKTGKVIREAPVKIFGAKELEEVMREFTEENSDLVKAMQKSVASAVNRYVKPYLYEIARSEYTAKDDVLRDTSDKIRAKKATTQYGRSLVLKSNRIKLSKFDINPTSPPNQKGIPVRDRIPGPFVQVRKDAAMPDMMRGVIVAKMQSGHIGLFYRIPGTKAAPKTLPNGKVVQRQKIKELISLSMSEMIREGLKVANEDKLGIAAIREDITRQIQKSVTRAKKRYIKKMAQEAGT